MKRFFFKTYRSFIINIQLIILLSFIFAGCKEEDTGIVSSGRDKIRFTFTVADIKGSTRANAEGIDNIVADDQIIAVCFDKEEKQIGIYYPEAIVKENDAFSFIPSTDDEIATIVLLPNWSKYLPTLPEITDKEALLSVIADFNYTGQQEEYLPMYGEAPYNPEVSTPASISLERKVSKIVIRNCMDGYDLTSATLQSAADKIAVGGTPQEAISGNSLSFMKGEEGELYLYVTPTILGDETSSSREILLTAKNKEDGTEETCTLWLKNYNEDEEQWAALEANTLYTFNVQGIDTETPPVVEQYSTVIVKWAPTIYGKFESYNVTATIKSTHKYKFLFREDNSSEINVVPPDIELYAGWKPTANLGQLVVSLDFKDRIVDISKIRYQVVDMYRPPTSDNPINRWNDELARNLISDGSWFSSKVENDILILTLTPQPIMYLIPDVRVEIFPTDHPYRLYWKNSNIASLSVIDQKSSYNGKYSSIPSPLSYGQFKDYNYVEFLPSEGQLYLHPYFIDSNGNELTNILDWAYSTDGLQTNAFFPQEIDGETYYVFFVD